jgi:hypothetical protein
MIMTTFRIREYVTAPDADAAFRLVVIKAMVAAAVVALVLL